MAYRSIRLAFIGSAGIPNRYGGFESFLEHCGPVFAEMVGSVAVTCDAALYEDQAPFYRGVRRLFVGVRANSWRSIIHDGLAFARVFVFSTHIIVLGVSGAPWFPIMRVLCGATGKRLIVNVDGLEWRRKKFSRFERWALKQFDALAQWCAHLVIVDNAGLVPYLTRSGRRKACLIGYSGDHVLATRSTHKIVPGCALTICRIEPENQLEVLIGAALSCPSVKCYTIVGNWDSSEYGRRLRDRFVAHDKLRLQETIYEASELNRLRSSCEVYFHGHSVGGTNPSLVEMLFYDCRIIAFDCSFNRATAGEGAEYFSGMSDLIETVEGGAVSHMVCRAEVRRRYTATSIAGAYLRACALPLRALRIAGMGRV